MHELNALLETHHSPYFYQITSSVLSWSRLLRSRCGITTGLVDTLPFPTRQGTAPPTKHFVTYDAWRRLLHVGGGNHQQQWLCGLILLEDKDLESPETTIIPHLRDVLKLGQITATWRLFVRIKPVRNGATNFNTPEMVVRANWWQSV
tara:strand:- start:744 stop:1187 length:444 start_codon:yes stop_codon:yes gene_type:complete